MLRGDFGGEALEGAADFGLGDDGGELGLGRHDVRGWRTEEGKSAGPMTKAGVPMARPSRAADKGNGLHLPSHLFYFR